MHAYVFKLESSMTTQNDIDGAYTDLCKVLTYEMKNILEMKLVKINLSHNNNKRWKVSKPWCSDTLTASSNE